MELCYLLKNNMTNKEISLKDKHILICVTGSIAAYKSCEIIRQLRKEGAHVQVMMTKSAQEFVGKATFAALTNNEVLIDVFPDTPKAGLEHIELAINDNDEVYILQVRPIASLTNKTTIKNNKIILKNLKIFCVKLQTVLLMN